MIVVRALLVIFLLLALAIPATSQGETVQTDQPAADQPSPADMREFFRILSDPRIVEWLKQNVAADSAAADVDAETSFRAEIENRLAAARSRISELAQAWSNFPLIPEVLANAWRAELSRGEALRSLTYVIIFLFVGGGLEWLFWQYFHPVIVRTEHSHPRSLWGSVAAGGVRLLLQACALAIFALGSVGTFLSFQWPHFLERIVVNLLLAVIVIRALAVVSRFVLSPRNSMLRLVPLASAMARRIHRWHIGVATIFVLSLLSSDTLSTLARTESGSREAIDAALAVSVALGAVAVATLVSMVWSLSGALRRENVVPSPVQRRFDPIAFKLLPVAQTVVILAAFVLWVFKSNELMWTVLVLGMFLPASRLVRTMVDHFFDRAEEALPERTDEWPDRADTAPASLAAPSVDASAIEATASGEIPAPMVPEARRADRFAVYRPLVRRFARFVLAAIALALLATAWGTNIAALSESRSFAGRAVKVAIDIVAALLIADLIWVWGKTTIDRRLAGFVAPPPGEPPGPEARMATLLPLLRNILLISVITLIGLTILSSLGVNIAPLLAGAGIAGVAIGFGAQSLVRDIVSGIFFLVDDAFRVGEYVEIGDLRGTVESMSLRSMRVRHHRGAVHTIPFGELKSLTNYSRDWVIMKLEFRVPFETDLRLVKKLVKQVGAELQADPNYGSQIIEPLKSQGVRRMEEFNMVIGVKFMAKPGAQWVIRRDAYQRLRDVFESNGISFAQRNVKVEVLADRPLPQEVRTAITGAAQAAIENRMAPRPLPDEP